MAKTQTISRKLLGTTAAMMTDKGKKRYRSDNGRYFNPDYYRMDKIHLNKKGHDVWTGLMKEALEALGIPKGEAIETPDVPKGEAAKA